MAKDVILTGLRANAEFHLGNYLGAILPMVELQKQHAGEYQLNMFVPDLHSFTTPVDHGKLYENTLDNLRTFVAAGLDINNPNTFIYRQSYIPAHSELTWILDCFASFGEVRRIEQFEEKAGLIRSRMATIPDDKLIGQNLKSLTTEEVYKQMKLREEGLKYLTDRIFLNNRALEKVSVGLFNYPVLMAADILLYGAKWVPVGEDQRQHIELTRDLAIRMNNKFNNLFKVPESWDKQLQFAKRDTGVRIRSLRNPEKKMSKSVADPAGTILLTDSPDEAAKKVMSATTDSLNNIQVDWDKQAGVSNLLQMGALLSNKSLQDEAQNWQGKTSYGELKSHVAELVKNFLTDFQTKKAAVDMQTVQSKLEQDETAMNDVANQTLYAVQKAVGLRP